MSKKEKPLPRPQDTPFGAKKRFEQERGDEPLLADELALAAARGRLDEFMHSKMPDNDYAKNLAMMMMGMTGMLPPEGNPSLPKNDSETASKDADLSDKTTPGMAPPEDLINAVHAGDVKGLMGILEREHVKRSPDADKSVSEKVNSTGEQPTIETEIVEKLLKIASENNLTVDWVVLRALKLYVQEHLKTGRL